jgi:FkbM family methyltransferase
MGLTSLLRRFGNLLKCPRSEDLFEKHILSSVQPGDTVWDIGANAGHYTRAFAYIVGENGCVLAFEPAPSALQALREINLATIQIVPVALSDRSGEGDFFTHADFDEDSGLTQARNGLSCVKVAIRTGDQFLAHAPPNVVKIDIEGFELDALRGMSQTLTHHALRAVFVEVHFEALARRRMSSAPLDIVKLLRVSGFNVFWLDSSHLSATRSDSGSSRTHRLAVGRTE